MDNLDRRKSIGPKIVNPEKAILSAEPFLDARRSPASKGRNEIDAGQYGYHAKAVWLPSRALLIRREVLNAIGGFDECYANGDIADADLCLKARFRDFKCVYAGTVTVRDNGAGTEPGDPETEPGFARFTEKWNAYSDLLSTRSQLDRVFNL